MSDGDQTPGVKDWIAKAEAYFVNKQATSIYLNFRANAGLIVGIKDVELRACKLIVPSYHGPSEPPYVPPGLQWFGHQYASDENTHPFGPDRHQPGADAVVDVHATRGESTAA